MRKYEITIIDWMFRIICSSQLASSPLKQFASSLAVETICIKSAQNNLHQVCWNNLHQVCSRQLGTSLLTTCNRLVVNKFSQAMRTHPAIGLLTTMLLQVANKLVATCAFLAVYILNKIREDKNVAEVHIRIFSLARFEKWYKWKIFTRV